jgi:hypothetical protein
VHQPAAGQHGLVGAGPLRRGGELLLVRRVEPGVVHRFVPRLERSLVEDEVEQLLRRQVSHAMS